MRAYNIDTQILILWASSWRRRGIKGTELRESNEGRHSRQGKRRSNTTVAQILEISMGERRVFFAERCSSFSEALQNRKMILSGVSSSCVAGYPEGGPPSDPSSTPSVLGLLQTAGKQHIKRE